MSGWFFAVGFAAVAAAGIIGLGRLPRATWELVGAALLVGIAGYGWQGSPGLPGAPRDAAAQRNGFDEQLAARRKDMGERFSEEGGWLVRSDALGRLGMSRDAANILIPGIREYPKDANLWVGLGNALVAHAGGFLTPSAEYAFKRAIRLDPKAAAPAYFYGLALVRAGRLLPARELWAALLRRAPKNADWRPELAQDIALLDAALARQGQAAWDNGPDKAPEPVNP